MTRARIATVLRAVVALAVLVTILGAVAWRTTGGHWYDVRTGSMGRAAPVGSLLLVRPATLEDVHPGDLVSFHSPGLGKVYSHRAVEVSEQGVRTKGDVNPNEDPWTISQGELVGKVSVVVPAGGYVLDAIPWFLLVLGLTWLVASLLRASWRPAVRVAGVGIAVAVACFLVQPWVGMDRVTVTGQGQQARLEVVSTGVLPIRAEIKDVASSPRLRAGEVGKVRIPADGSKYSVDAVPSLTGWWWVLIALLCLAPLLCTLLIGVREVPEPEAAGPDAVDDGRDEGERPDRDSDATDDTDDTQDPDESEDAGDDLMAHLMRWSAREHA